MKTRSSVLTMIGLAATFAAAAAFAPASTPASGPGHSHAKIGKPAPDFTLKDAKGKEYTLASYKEKGEIVVLQWINPGCPVCKRVTSKGPIKKMVKELEAIDSSVVILAINSTYGTPPADSAAYLKKHAYDVPALSDGDGKVGHMYGAKTTPHMYVIDGKGILRYSGALDDDGRGRKGDEAINYVVNAVRQIKAGETVSPDQVKSYGCSVKYQKKK